MGEKIIFSLIGFVVGAFTGGVIMSKNTQKEFNDRINILEAQNQQLLEDVKRLKSEELEKREKSLEKEERRLEKKSQKEEAVSKYRRLSSKYRTESKEEEAEDSDDEEQAEEENPFTKADRIKMIDEITWKDSLNMVDNEALTYYQEDGTLVDSAGDIITNEESIVGNDVMDIIDETNNDYLYALDNEADKMYEISIQHNASYMRDVLGVN